MVGIQSSRAVIALAAEAVRMDFREGVPEGDSQGLTFLREEGIYPSRTGNLIRFFRMIANEGGDWVKEFLEI